MNLDAPYLTRPELLALSAFDLPVKHARHVPGLTAERLRTCERSGLIRVDCFPLQKAGPILLRYRPRRSGDTRLYTARDLGMARLVAWMARARVRDRAAGRESDGLTMREIALALRASGVRLFLGLDRAETLHVSRYRSTGAVIGATVPVGMRMLDVPPEMGTAWEFPLAWLGLNGGWLPRLQKMREQHPGEVWRHRWVPVEELAAQELRAE